MAMKYPQNNPSKNLFQILSKNSVQEKIIDLLLLQVCRPEALLMFRVL